jgi:hypothetical protein
MSFEAAGDASKSVLDGEISTSLSESKRRDFSVEIAASRWTRSAF